MMYYQLPQMALNFYSILHFARRVLFTMQLKILAIKRRYSKRMNVKEISNSKEASANDLNRRYLTDERKRGESEIILHLAG